MLRYCELCGEYENFEPDRYQFVSLRPFITTVLKREYLFHVHQQCAIASPEVVLHNEKWYNVSKAVQRGRRIRCVKCNEKGATVGCMDMRCSKSFHLECTGTNWMDYFDIYLWGIWEIDYVIVCVIDCVVDYVIECVIEYVFDSIVDSIVDGVFDYVFECVFDCIFDCILDCVFDCVFDCIFQCIFDCIFDCVIDCICDSYLSDSFFKCFFLIYLNRQTQFGAQNERSLLVPPTRPIMGQRSDLITYKIILIISLDYYQGIFTCDGCDQTLEATWMQCIECQTYWTGYDLCATCFSGDLADEHKHGRAAFAATCEAGTI